MSYVTYEVNVFPNGTRYWAKNGERHRQDGPAVEYGNGDKAWYINGKLHREDGPAIEWVNGTKKWYINGKELTEAEFNARTKVNTTCTNKIVEIDGVQYRLTPV